MSLAVNNASSTNQVVAQAATNIRDWVGRYSAKDFEFSRVSTCGVNSIASDDIVDEVIADVEDLLDRCGPDVTLSPNDGILSDVKLSSKTGCLSDGTIVNAVIPNFTDQGAVIASFGYDRDLEIVNNANQGIGYSRSITQIKWVGTCQAASTLDLGLYSPFGNAQSYGTITVRVRFAALTQNSTNPLNPGGNIVVSFKPYDGNPTFLTNRSAQVDAALAWGVWTNVTYRYDADPRAQVLLTTNGVAANPGAYYFEMKLVCSESFANPARAVPSFVDSNRNVRPINRTTLYTLFSQVRSYDPEIVNSIHARFGKQMYSWRSYIASLYRTGTGATITVAFNTVTGQNLGDDAVRNFLSGYILTWTTTLAIQCDYKQFYDNVTSLLRANLSRLTTDKSARKALLEARSVQA
jgi:hypothetical protein